MKVAPAIIGLVAFPCAIILMSRAAVSNQWIAGGVYTLTCLAILVCLIAASASRSRARCIACGCAVFAVSYFFFAVIVSDLWAPAARFVGMRAEPPRPQFTTTFWLAWLYDQVSNQYMELWTSGGTRAPALHLMTVSASQIPKDMDLSTLETFIRTGHCMFTWLVGAVGGLVGAWFYRLPPITDLPQPISADRL